MFSRLTSHKMPSVVGDNTISKAKKMNYDDGIKYVTNRLIGATSGLPSSATDIATVVQNATQIKQIMNTQKSADMFVASELVLDHAKSSQVAMDALFNSAFAVDRLYTLPRSIDLLLQSSQAMQALFANQSAIDKLFSNGTLVDKLIKSQVAMDKVALSAYALKKFSATQAMRLKLINNYANLQNAAWVNSVIATLEASNLFSKSTGNNTVPATYTLQGMNGWIWIYNQYDVASNSEAGAEYHGDNTSVMVCGSSGVAFAGGNVTRNNLALGGFLHNGANQNGCRTDYKAYTII